MDRETWLGERRDAVEADYDAGAASYDDLDYPADMQHEWVGRVLELIAPGATVLDAPCGTGRFFALITGAGMRVVGVDQSAGMLAQAGARIWPSPLTGAACRTCLASRSSTPLSRSTRLRTCRLRTGR